MHDGLYTNIGLLLYHRVPYTVPYTVPCCSKAYAKKRFGFIKLAIRNGSDIVPCYNFGESELYVNRL